MDQSLRGFPPGQRQRVRGLTGLAEAFRADPPRFNKATQGAHLSARSGLESSDSGWPDAGQSIGLPARRHGFPSIPMTSLLEGGGTRSTHGAMALTTAVVVR